MEKEIKSLENSKSQSDNLKQNYERLASILKNTEDGREKNIEDILIDYSMILSKLNSVKNDLSQKES